MPSSKMLMTKREMCILLPLRNLELRSWINNIKRTNSIHNHSIDHNQDQYPAVELEINIQINQDINAIVTIH